MTSKSHIRIWIIYTLVVVTPLGFLAKLYSGPGRGWFNNYGAGVLYEIFWVLVIFFVFPKEGFIGKIPISVFVITAVLEVSQLWRPWFLEKIRSTFLGSALIGSTFSWLDFPCYATGCAIGWLWIKQIAKRSGDR